MNSNAAAWLDYDRDGLLELGFLGLESLGEVRGWSFFDLRRSARLELAPLRLQRQLEQSRRLRVFTSPF